VRLTSAGYSRDGHRIDGHLLGHLAPSYPIQKTEFHNPTALCSTSSINIEPGIPTGFFDFAIEIGGRNRIGGGLESPRTPRTSVSLLSGRRISGPTPTFVRVCVCVGGGGEELGEP
jgi:hypothetical protein